MNRKYLIYGSSQNAIKAYIRNRDKYNIIGFVDRNVDVIGKRLLNLPIYSLDFVEANSENYVLLSNYSFFYEIEEALSKRGLTNRVIVDEGNVKLLQKMANKTISIGRLLESGSDNIDLRNLTFIGGGSGVLDYALLRYLVKRYAINSYLEIGSYIGESIKNVSDLCSNVYCITLPPTSDKGQMEKDGLTNFSGWLIEKKNVHCYFEDARYFDWTMLCNKDIGLYFIDGDHSYSSIYCDTINVLNNANENSFIVWHDCKDITGGGAVVCEETVDAIHEALGEKFENFFLFDNNRCGIYIPKKYLNDFPIGGAGEKCLYTYNVEMKIERVDRINE